MQAIDKIDSVVFDMATPRQQEIITYRRKHSLIETANYFNLAKTVICSYISRALMNSARKGHQPTAGLTNQTAEGFSTKRVSTLYGDEGQVKAQWHIQEPEKSVS